MKNIVLISVFLSLAVTTSVVSAAVPNDRGIGNSLLPPASTQTTTKVSKREASDLAREKFEGRVLSIRLSGKRWRVRMDDEGRVFNVFVDANSGETSPASE